MFMSVLMHACARTLKCVHKSGFLFESVCAYRGHCPTYFSKWWKQQSLTNAGNVSCQV